MGEDGLARDWYMAGKGGLAGKGGNLAQHNIQEEEKQKDHKFVTDFFKTNMREAIKIKGYCLVN